MAKDRRDKRENADTDRTERKLEENRKASNWRDKSPSEKLFDAIHDTDPKNDK